MYSPFIFAAAVLSLASLTLAKSASCPYNYPAFLNNTANSNGLVLTVISNNPVTNNRVVQLRPNPNLAGGFYAGIDANSSVLLSNLANGSVVAQARNIYNQLYNLGPTAYLNQQEVVYNVTKYTVGFANATIWPGAVDKTWQLEAPNAEGEYSLYHDSPLEIANGFLLCVAKFDLTPGPWYQLLYTEYGQGYNGQDLPGCEFVGVRVAVGATIYNGKCSIGQPAVY